MTTIILSPATTFNELVVWLPLHSSGTGTETSILTKKKKYKL